MKSPIEERPSDEVSIRALSDVPATSNRRAHARYAVELDVSIQSDHNFYAGFTENLSAGGVFVATHVLKPVGTMVEFAVFLPGSDSAIKGKGEVRWVRPYHERSNVPPGIGIRFVELEPGAEEAIGAFIAQRDPMFFDDED